MKKSTPMAIYRDHCLMEVWHSATLKYVHMSWHQTKYYYVVWCQLNVNILYNSNCVKYFFHISQN